MKKLYNLMLLEHALHSTDSYPKSIVEKDGTETQRSEYGNGWNDAVRDIYQRWYALQNYFLKLSNIEKEVLGNLISDDIVYIHNDKIFIQINNIFVDGSDEEEIDIKDIHVLFTLWINYKYDGVIAFVAMRRDTKPINTYESKYYRDAVKYINDYVLEKKE